MKNITLNGKKHNVYAAEIRAIQTLACQGWCAARNDFQEGRGRHRTFILPRGSRAKLLGIREVWPCHAKSKREQMFFKARPRLQSAIFGDPRRIKAILKQIGFGE